MPAPVMILAVFYFSPAGSLSCGHLPASSTRTSSALPDGRARYLPGRIQFLERCDSFTQLRNSSSARTRQASSCISVFGIIADS
jgi:hypothetical protein